MDDSHSSTRRDQAGPSGSSSLGEAKLGTKKIKSNAIQSFVTNDVYEVLYRAAVRFCDRVLDRDMKNYFEPIIVGSECMRARRGPAAYAFARGIRREARREKRAMAKMMMKRNSSSSTRPTSNEEDPFDLSSSASDSSSSSDSDIAEIDKAAYFGYRAEESLSAKSREIRPPMVAEDGRQITLKHRWKQFVMALDVADEQYSRRMEAKLKKAPLQSSAFTQEGGEDEEIRFVPYQKRNLFDDRFLPRNIASMKFRTVASGNGGESVSRPSPVSDGRSRDPEAVSSSGGGVNIPVPASISGIKPYTTPTPRVSTGSPTSPFVSHQATTSLSGLITSSGTASTTGGFRFGSIRRTTVPPSSAQQQGPPEPTTVSDEARELLAKKKVTFGAEPLEGGESTANRNATTTGGSTKKSILRNSHNATLSQRRYDDGQDDAVVNAATKLRPSPATPNSGQDESFWFTFHGTGRTAAMSILCEGFQPSVRDTQAFGVGEYFGPAHVARSFGNGEAILVCLVLRSKAADITYNRHPCLLVRNPIVPPPRADGRMKSVYQSGGVSFCLPIAALFAKSTTHSSSSSIPQCIRCSYEDLIHSRRRFLRKQREDEERKNLVEAHNNKVREKKEREKLLVDRHDDNEFQGSTSGPGRARHGSTAASNQEGTASSPVFVSTNPLYSMPLLPPTDPKKVRGPEPSEVELSYEDSLAEKLHLPFSMSNEVLSSHFVVQYLPTLAASAHKTWQSYPEYTSRQILMALDLGWKEIHASLKGRSLVFKVDPKHDPESAHLQHTDPRLLKLRTMDPLLLSPDEVKLLDQLEKAERDATEDGIVHYERASEVAHFCAFRLDEYDESSSLRSGGGGRVAEPRRVRVVARQKGDLFLCTKGVAEQEEEHNRRKAKKKRPRMARDD